MRVWLEPDAPAFGEPFRLRADLRVPHGTVVFLPDTLLPSDATESIGRGEWSTTPGPADSFDVRVTYPVMGFRGGESNLPALQIWLRPNGGATPLPEADVRAVAELGSDPSARAQPRLVRLGTVTIASLLPDGDSVSDLELRPAADVSGGRWNGWIILAAALTTIGAAAGARMIIRRALGGDGAMSAAPTPRAEALRALDRIRAAGWHRDGRTVDFYAATTDALRRFAERSEPEWGPALTSSELLGRIEERWDRDSVRTLVESIAVAESVKFGRHRPDAESAERDWEIIRRWVQSTAGRV